MTRHQRSKSFSDSLLLADDGNGGVVVSGIRGDSMTNQGLKEGDEIVGATISFNDLKKDEILDILKLIEPYNDKIQVLTKQDLKPSKSMGNLDLETVKTPDEMLRNSNNTFFNAKVKKFLKDNPSSGAMPGNVSPHENPEELKPDKERDAISVDLNMDLSSLNGKPKVDVTDFLKAAKQRQKGNVPTTDVKSQDPSDTPKPILNTTETAENCLSAEVSLPQVKAPDEISGGIELPVVDVVAKSPDISEVDPSGLMPTAHDHNIGVGVDMAEPNANVKTDTDISTSPPVVLRGKDLVQSTLDVSLPVLHAESPETTVKLTDDIQVPSSTIEIDVLPSDTNPPEVEFPPPNTDIHISSKNKTKPSKRKSRSRVRAPELDLDSPSGYEYSSTGIPDLNLDIPSAYKYVPDALPDLNLDVPSAYNYVPNGLPDLNVDMPSAYEYTSRKLAQEKPTLIIASPKTKRRSKAPDLKGKVSKGDLSIPQAEIGLNVPDLEADIKVPDIGTLPKASSLDTGGGIKSGSLNTKTPKVTGSIDMPNPGGHLPKIDFKGPETDLNIPDVDVDSSSGKFKMPRFKIPKFSFSGLKSPNVALEENLTAPDLKMPSPKIAAKTRGPTFDSNIPTAEWKGLKSIKTPKLEGPDCEINPPGLDVAIPDIDMHFEKPDLNGPDIDSPNLNVDMPSAPSGKLKKPKFGLSGTLPKGPEADLKMPSMNVSGPKLKGDFSVPDTDMRLRKPNLKGPKLDLNSPDVNIGAPSGTLKMPKFKMPKFSLPGLKGPDVGIDGDLDGPDLSVSPPKVGAAFDNPDMDINVPGARLRGPKADITGPDVDIGKPSGKLNWPGFKMPDFGLSKPKVKGPDFDIKTPDVDFSAPKIKGEIKAPRLSSPDFKLKNPNLDVSVPNADLDMPTGKLKKPKIDLSAPDFDFDAPSGKLKMPKFGLSGTLPKGPEADLKMPSMNVSGPKLKGDFNVPDTDMRLGKPHLKGPKLDLNSPDVNIGAPSGTLKMHKFKMPKFSLPGLKGPDVGIDGDLDGPDLRVSPPKVGAAFDNPDMDINLPGARLRGPKADITGPDVDIGKPSGKLNWPGFKMPDFGLSGPKVKGPDFDIKTPDADFSSPRIKGEIKAPKLGSPDVKLKNPNLDVSGPNADLDMPTGKLSKLKKPKIDLSAPDFDFDAPSGKLKMPKFSLSGTLPKEPEADLKMPSMNVSGPKLKGDLNVPDTDMRLGKPHLKGPKLDLNSPDVNIGAPSGTLKMPKFKMPKFSLPGLKGPDVGIDGDLDGPDLSVSPPKVGAAFDNPDMDINVPGARLRGPKADITGPDVDIGKPSGKFNWPGFKMPDFGLSKPKVKGPDFDIKTPDVDFSSPRIKGEIKAPKLGSPDFKLKNPNLDVSGPNADLDMPAGKLPKLKKPKIDLSAPDFDFDAPSGKLKMPKFGLSGTLPKGPEADLKMPSMNVSGPKLKGDFNVPDTDMRLGKPNLKGPKLDLNSPDVNIGAPSGTLKMPKFKMPKFNLPGLKGPDVGIDGDLDGPDLRVSPPKVGAAFDNPDMDINVPGARLRGPKADITGPDVDIGKPSGKFNWPGFKMPDFGLSGPKVKGPDFDIKTPDVDFSAPKIKGEIKAPRLSSPDFKLKNPNLDVSVPNADLDMPTGKLKKPKIDLSAPDFDFDAPSGKLKMPKFGLSGTLPKGPEADLKMPSMNVRGPKLKGDFNVPDTDMRLGKPHLKSPKLDLNSPDVNIGAPSGTLKMPKFKMPKFNLPGLKGPDVGIDGDLDEPDLSVSPPKVGAAFDNPDVDINAPGAHLRGPKADITGPDVDIGKPSGKFNWPGFKMPDFGLSGPKVKGPDFDIKNPDVDFSAPKIKGEIKAPKFCSPDVQLKNPNLDISVTDADLDRPTGKLPKLKKPKIDLSAPDFDLDAPSGKLKMPKFDLSGTLPKGPEADLKMPSMNVSEAKLKGDFNVPDTDMRLGKPHLKGPKLDLNSPDANIKAPSGTLKMPKLKMPKFSPPGLKGPDVDIDGDCDLSGDLNLSPPKIGGLDGPDVGGGITIPDMDLSIPSIKGDQNPNAYNGNITEPNLKLSPKVNGKMPEGQVQVSGTLKEPRIPDLDIDATLGKYKSHKKLRNDALDLDADVKFSNNVRPSRKTKGRASYPVSKENVMASALDTKVPLPEFPPPRDRVMTLPESSIHVSKTDMAGFAKAQKPGDGDVQKKKRPKSMEFLDSVGVDIEERSKTKRELYNGKLNSLKSLDVSTSNVDLDVPDATLKGSRFNLLGLI